MGLMVVVVCVGVLEVVQRRRDGGNNFNLQVHFAKFEQRNSALRMTPTQPPAAVYIAGCAYYSPVTGLMGRVIMAHEYNYRLSFSRMIGHDGIKSSPPQTCERCWLAACFSHIYI
jgi:hypothetical protein